MHQWWSWHFLKLSCCIFLMGSQLEKVFCLPCTAMFWIYTFNDCSPGVSRAGSRGRVLNFYDDSEQGGKEWTLPSTYSRFALHHLCHGLVCTACSRDQSSICHDSIGKQQFWHHACVTRPAKCYKCQGGSAYNKVQTYVIHTCTDLNLEHKEPVAWLVLL